MFQLEGHDLAIGVYSSEAACLRLVKLGRQLKEIDLAMLVLTVQPEALGHPFEVRADHLSCMGLHFGVQDETLEGAFLGLQKAKKWTCEVVLEKLTASSFPLWEISQHVPENMLTLYIVLLNGQLVESWSCDSLVLGLSCVTSQVRVPFDESHEGLHEVPRWRMVLSPGT